MSTGDTCGKGCDKNKNNLSNGNSTCYGQSILPQKNIGPIQFMVHKWLVDASTWLNRVEFIIIV